MTAATDLCRHMTACDHDEADWRVPSRQPGRFIPGGGTAADEGFREPSAPCRERRSYDPRRPSATPRGFTESVGAQQAPTVDDRGRSAGDADDHQGQAFGGRAELETCP